jgi:hypothetical protein
VFTGGGKSGASGVRAGGWATAAEGGFVEAIGCGGDGGTAFVVEAAAWATVPAGGRGAAGSEATGRGGPTGDQ